MKALIISDDDNLIKRISAVLGRNGYDCIVYHWLLKALDNVEEITPHLVIINAKDYPRHWKTFVQYTSGIEETTPKVILIIDRDFSLEEKKKAQALGINGLFPSECSDKDFESVLKIVYPELSSEESIEDKNIKSNSKKDLFIFSNPVNNNFVTGRVLSLKSNILEFKLDNIQEIHDMTVGLNIPNCSLRFESNVRAVSAVVESIPKDTVEPLVLKIEGI